LFVVVRCVVCAVGRLLSNVVLLSMLDNVFARQTDADSDSSHIDWLYIIIDTKQTSFNWFSLVNRIVDARLTRHFA
jgi:hypothetical protein